MVLLFTLTANVKVEATEQSKLAARAWGATLTSAKFDEQNKSGGQTSGSSARKSGARSRCSILCYLCK